MDFKLKVNFVLHDPILQNILSPSVLFFFLGAIAGILKSDLNVPEALSRYLGVYLMMSLGFKGGAMISAIEYFTSEIFYIFIIGIIFSFSLPFAGYFFLTKTTKLDKPTSAALAAHYGSVSIVTFAAAVNFLEIINISYSGYMASVLAIMEAPAILSGLFLAHRAAPETNTHSREERKLAREIFANGAVLLILGSLIIGAISGKNGLEKVSGFLIDPFQGILCLFLMDMGLIVTRNLKNLKAISLNIVLFGIYMPIFSALISAFVMSYFTSNIGNLFLFMVLCASSSYIAVPAAMRLALPEAKPQIYIPISLAVTFPLNITFGIPLYFYIAKIIF